MEEIVSVEKVTRSFPLNHDRTRNLVSALNGVSLRVEAGEFLAIAGPSGSGKTTLLNLIGCIDQPTSGRVLIDGVDTSRLSPGSLTELRREKIGFVFQTFNLIPVFTAAENVEFPLLIQGLSSGERRERTDPDRAPIHAPRDPRFGSRVELVFHFHSSPQQKDFLRIAR